MIKFTITSTKGGVGKTTLTANLGALLAEKPVIAVCDGADPYGNGGLVFSHTNTGAPALRQKLAGHLSTLMDYGINLVKEEEFVTAVQTARR